MTVLDLMRKENASELAELSRKKGFVGVRATCSLRPPPGALEGRLHGKGGVRYLDPSDLDAAPRPAFPECRAQIPLTCPDGRGLLFAIGISTWGEPVCGMVR